MKRVTALVRSWRYGSDDVAARPLKASAEAIIPAALTASDLERHLRERPAEVDAALQQVSPVGARLGTAEMAAFFGVTAEADPAAFAARAVAYLHATRLIDEFSAVLGGDRTAADMAAEIANMNIDPEVGERLFRRTHLARCAVWRDGQFAGSGCLVSPSLVLTCAHVIGAAHADGTFPALQVELASGARIGVMERTVRLSREAAADRVLPLASDDLLFDNCHDFALLRLRVPAGANGSVVECPQEDWRPTRHAPLFLLHFPSGEDRGVGIGQLATFRRPSRRWGYVAPAKPGSSGGAVFNAKGELVGIHQGKLSEGKRLVPLHLFRPEIAGDIANDLWPSYLWSPEGRLDGTLVIGRGDLFRAFALMAPQGATHRLLRIKRLDHASGIGGLGYSVRLARQLVDRLPRGHREITLSWPQALFHDFDIVEELGAAARAAGLLDSSDAIPPSSGPLSRPGEAKILKERLDQLLRAFDAAATQRGETVWLIVEHSSVPLGDQTIALELLASLAPKWPSLRMLLIGNETVSLAEPEFRLDDVAQNHLPGVALVEWLGPISRAEVSDFIAALYLAYYDDPIDDDLLAQLTTSTLKGVKPLAGRYAPADLPRITARLRDILRPLVPADAAEPQP